MLKTNLQTNRSSITLISWIIIRTLIHGTIVPVNAFISVGVQHKHQQHQLTRQLSLRCSSPNSAWTLTRSNNYMPLFHSPINDDAEIMEDVIATISDNNDGNVADDALAHTTTAIDTTTTTTVGSSTYYQGFITRPVNDEPAERVTGNAILGPTFKFVGIMTVIIVGLTAAFLMSNGII